jgi:hypothetical protein
MTPAIFEIKKILALSMLSSIGAITGIVKVGNESTGGETVLSPPTGGKKTPERYLAPPAAIKLMARPDTA